MERDLDWTVLRPAVVIGEDSYGGTSLLRALAAFPFVMPVLGDGSLPIQFIHKDDLARGVVRLLQDRGAVREVLYPASAESVTLLEALGAYRSWLGLRPGRVVQVPTPVASAVARAGDITNMQPIASTSLAQVLARLTGDGGAFDEATGIGSRGLGETLAARPAGSQDLWHARLFLGKRPPIPPLRGGCRPSQA